MLLQVSPDYEGAVPVDPLEGGREGFSIRELDRSLATAGTAVPISGQPPAVMVFPNGLPRLGFGDPVPFENQGRFCEASGHGVEASARPSGREEGKKVFDLTGTRVLEIGPRVQQWLLEALPLRSQRILCGLKGSIVRSR